MCTATNLPISIAESATDLAAYPAQCERATATSAAHIRCCADTVKNAEVAELRERWVAGRSGSNSSNNQAVSVSPDYGSFFEHKLDSMRRAGGEAEEDEYAYLYMDGEEST